MEFCRLLFCTTLLLLFALLRHRTFESESSPPAASPPSPLRLTFGVRRRRRAERAQQVRRKHAGVAFEQISSKDASLPPASAEPPPPPPTDFILGRSTRVNTACTSSGRESGPGCHHHPCLLGVCICGDGSGGETCERGGQRIFNRSCHAAEELAYGGAQSDGLTRHAQHDVCAFYEPAYGILRVDERRWKFAQLWEASLWSAAPASQTTDRNAHHALQFDQYRALPDALGHVLEIGSGPYTQTQSLLLRPGSSTSSITLVDPLARVFMDRTKGCTYKEQRLHGHPVRVLNVPAESLSLTHAADTLVMVSVLQSVRDVPAVLQAAYNALKPGGWLVFADRVFDARWDAFRAGAAPFWDVGHPCAVKETLLDHFLSVFEEVQRRRWAKEPSARAGDGRHPALQDEQIYFIGRKSAAEPVSLSFGG